MKAVIFDLDGTIADISHRVGYVRTKPKNWPAFEAGIPHDTPNGMIADLPLILSKAGYEIIIASGRSEDSKEPTETWLADHGVYYDRLFMRKSEDYRRDDIVKKEILEEILELGYQPKMVFDDRQQVVDMWREEGILCAQVAPGDF